jgi:hypothetical protein
MTGISPLILSLAMLAAFALLGGGAWLIAKRRDRRRGVLMIVAAAVLVVNVLIWAIPVGAAVPLPPDVRAFIARRGSCEHWLGEEPYDAARRREIDRAVAADCTGADRTLKQLRVKYRGHRRVLNALARYNSRIE